MLLGLDSAGKSTLLNKLKLGDTVVEAVEPVPTLGFNVDMIKYGDTVFEYLHTYRGIY